MKGRNTRRLHNFIRRFGGKCCYCGKSVVMPGKGIQKAHWATGDHAEPRCTANRKGNNRRLCCYSCNQAKGPLSAAEFLALRHDGKALKAAVRARNIEIEARP